MPQKHARTVSGDSIKENQIIDASTLSAQKGYRINESAFSPIPHVYGASAERLV